MAPWSWCLATAWALGGRHLSDVEYIQSQQLEWRSDTRDGAYEFATLDVNGANAPERFVGAQTVLSTGGEGKVMAVDGASGQVIWEQDGSPQRPWPLFSDANGDARPQLWVHNTTLFAGFSHLKLGSFFGAAMPWALPESGNPTSSSSTLTRRWRFLVTSDVSAVVFDGAQYQEEPAEYRRVRRHSRLVGCRSAR